MEDTIERSSRKAKFLFDFPQGLDVTERSVKGEVLRVKKASRETVYKDCLASVENTLRGFHKHRAISPIPILSLLGKDLSAA